MSSEINIIKRFASWNDFPKSVVNSIINKTLNTPSNNEGPNINNTEKSNEITIYFRFLIMVIKVFHYSNLAFIKSNLIAKKDHPILFRLLYDVTKLELFCDTKERTPKLNESFIVYI